MYNERKSVVPPRTPSTGRVAFNVPPQPQSGFHGRMADLGRPSVAASSRSSLAADARSSIATGILAGRPSAIPGNQGRRIMPVPKMQTIKDERNLRDKEMQTAIIQKVVRFLEDRMSPAPPFRFDERSFLRNPSKNDFKNVFEYLFQCIDPSFQVKKIEEDALRLMNQLGYPYPLKQSTMQTITVPSTWPQFLGVLDWLVDIVEVENAMYQSSSKVSDEAQWQLLTGCFKKRETLAKGPAQSIDLTQFKQEMEEYRRCRMAEHGEAADTDAFDELRARRVAQEQNINQIEDIINEEKTAIEKIEQNIADMEKDIETLEKYKEDLMTSASQNEQILVDVNKVNDDLLEQLNALIKENGEKEHMITNQKISGEKARELVAKRQSLREELLMIRENLVKADQRVYELQPKYYKQSAKIRSDYDTFMSGLRGLCESLFAPIELEQKLNELQQCDFDRAFAEFQQARDNNRLTRLLVRLKELAEHKIHSFQQTEEAAARTEAQLTQEIAELETLKEQRQTNQKLELERTKREKDDRMRPLIDLKHSLDVVKQKHQSTADELEKYNRHLEKLHEELASKHKNYMDYKQRLDALYSGLQTQVLEKMTRLCDRFTQIQEQKTRYKQLGDEILAKNIKTLRELRAQKGEVKHIN